jgi:hypothetical protein
MKMTVRASISTRAPPRRGKTRKRMPGIIRGIMLIGGGLMWIGGWVILPFNPPLAAPIIAAGAEIAAVAATTPPNPLDGI